MPELALALSRRFPRYNCGNGDGAAASTGTRRERLLLPPTATNRPHRRTTDMTMSAARSAPDPPRKDAPQIGAAVAADGQANARTVPPACPHPVEQTSAQTRCRTTDEYRTQRRTAWFGHAAILPFGCHGWWRRAHAHNASSETNAENFRHRSLPAHRRIAQPKAAM